VDDFAFAASGDQARRKKFPHLVGDAVRIRRTLFIRYIFRTPGKCRMIQRTQIVREGNRSVVPVMLRCATFNKSCNSPAHTRRMAAIICSVSVVRSRHAQHETVHLTVARAAQASIVPDRKCLSVRKLSVGIGGA